LAAGEIDLRGKVETACPEGRDRARAGLWAVGGVKDARRQVYASKDPREV